MDSLVFPLRIALPGRTVELTVRPFWWWNADSRGVEAISAMLAWYWGVLLLLPFDTFDASPSYRVMATIAPEYAWGVFYCFIGLIQSAALCGGVYWFRGPGALLAIVGWTAAALMFFISNPFTHAVGIYSLLTCANLWVVMRGPMHDGR